MRLARRAAECLSLYAIALPRLCKAAERALLMAAADAAVVDEAVEAAVFIEGLPGGMSRCALRQGALVSLETCMLL